MIIAEHVNVSSNETGLIAVQMKYFCSIYQFINRHLTCNVFFQTGAKKQKLCTKIYDSSGAFGVHFDPAGYNYFHAQDYLVCGGNQHALERRNLLVRHNSFSESSKRQHNPVTFTLLKAHMSVLQSELLCALNWMVGHLTRHLQRSFTAISKITDRKGFMGVVFRYNNTEGFNNSIKNAYYYKIKRLITFSYGLVR